MKNDNANNRINNNKQWQVKLLNIRQKQEEHQMIITH